MVINLNKKNKNISQKNKAQKKYNLDAKNTLSPRIAKTTLIIVIIIFLLLVVRLIFLQIIDGERLSTLAVSQQTKNKVISSKRGNIYDSTGVSLAISETVDTISINPSKLEKKTEEATKKNQELVAKGLSEIFELDYKETLEKITSDSSVVTIAKKVEEDKVNELKAWMKENDVSIGINIDEDTKRYYPNGTLASQVIGVCGTDNQGLSGIEASYDSILTGTSGRIVTSKDASQSEIPNSIKSFIEAENGYNLTLTIDVKIQSIVEKYLEEAVEKNECSLGGNCIVMDPSTGDILAMASFPYYDLNDPYTVTSYYADDWDDLDKAQRLNRIYKMWSVRPVSETYEPGSVFKLITAAVALEEDITDTDVKNDFYCSGIEEVADRKIKCWKYYDPHESQTLRKALMNSCNPSFIQLGQRIGAKKLYKYYDGFGFFDKTNVGLSGEASGIFYDLDDVGDVELATMSFGQRFTITPLQMCTALSAIANNGYLVQPKLVKSITNTDTNEITTFDTTVVRQVISAQTANEIKDMMKSVVTDGTGKTAQVKGYSVGGKSGTSEPTAGNQDAGYVASFAAISPIENTKVAILLTLYDPNGNSHQGGQVAGPVVSDMLTEILPYLGVEPDLN